MIRKIIGTMLILIGITVIILCISVDSIGNMSMFKFLVMWLICFISAIAAVFIGKNLMGEKCEK